MRLFVALPIPETVKEQLADLQQPIRGMNWQDKDKMHLTLKFIGETSADRMKEVKAYLGEINHSGFDMNLNGLGVFPKQDQPKVLWVGIEKNKQLLKLQKKIEHTCSELGFEAEDRPFHPHITIARTKHATKKDVNTFIKQHTELRISDVHVREFILYESKLDSEGAIHTPLKQYSLKNS